MPWPCRTRFLSRPASWTTPFTRRSTVSPKAVHKGIPASIQGRHLAAEEVHRLCKGKGHALAVCPVGAVYQFLVHGKNAAFRSAVPLSARRVTSLAIRLRAASGDVQMYKCTNCTDVQIQLCTSVQFVRDANFYTNFYTHADGKSTGRQHVQAENEAVKIPSRTVSETRCYGLLVFVHEACYLGDGKPGFYEVRRYLPNRLDLSLSIERQRNRMMRQAMTFRHAVVDADNGKLIAVMRDSEDAYDCCDYLVTIRQDATVLDLWSEI